MMKSVLKKMFCLCLVLVMMGSLSACSDLVGGAYFLHLVTMGDDRAEKDEIFEFVRENEKELLKAIEQNDFSAFENQGFIKDIDADQADIDFECGGAGMGSGTSYVGFYYASSGNAVAVGLLSPVVEQLIPCEDGFEWRELNGDNRYYTEHICGSFYYYEQSF